MSKIAFMKCLVNPLVSVKMFLYNLEVNFSFFNVYEFVKWNKIKLL